MICIPLLGMSSPFWLYLEMMIFSKPSFSASVIRWSMRLTGRISPESPTSAEKHIFGSMGISSLEESTEVTTARSIAGSSTLIPPAIFRKTSFAPSLNPHLFSRQQATCLVFADQNLLLNAEECHKQPNLPAPEFR